MKIGLAEEISKDILNKSSIITKISIDLEKFFQSKNYGKGINTLFIGLVCVSPEFEFFFKERTKYVKTKKLLEYDIKINHKSFKVASEKEGKKLIASAIVNSLDVIGELNIDDFNLKAFRIDMISFLKDYTDN